MASDQALGGATISSVIMLAKEAFLRQLTPDTAPFFVAQILFEYLIQDLCSDKATRRILSRHQLARELNRTYPDHGVTPGALEAAPTRVGQRLRNFSYRYPAAAPTAVLRFVGPIRDVKREKMTRGRLFLTYKVEPCVPLSASAGPAPLDIDTQFDPGADPGAFLHTSYVALTHSRFYWPDKREALLFDRIALLDLQDLYDDNRISKTFKSEWAYLAEKDALHEIRLTSPDLDKLRGSHIDTLGALLELSAAEDGGEALKLMTRAGAYVASRPEPQSRRLQNEVYKTVLYAISLGVVQLAKVMSNGTAWQAIPLVPKFFGPAIKNPTETSHVAVISVILNALPEPSAETPWEQIIEFRSDPQAMAAARRLRLWATTIGSQIRSAHDLEAELESLVQVYQSYMRIHEIRARRARMEAVVTAVTDVADALRARQTVKLAPLAKALFTVSQQNLNLLQAELNAPGREVAFIARARRRFGNTAHTPPGVSEGS